ncbi:MAG: extracellular solute-binding protein [Gemmatimonadaceae bacterium]
MNRPLARRSARALASVGLLAVGLGCGKTNSAATGGGNLPLVVFNAGALAIPLRQALDSFSRRNGAIPNQESAGSIESVRKITDLGRNPDIIAVADTALFGTMLHGRLDGPVAVLGSSRLVLAYTSNSRFADSVTSDNWTDLTTRPGVQVGRSDPTLDPAGYRALMAMQLAERYYGQPGLAARLKAAAPDADMRPKSADLTALLQTGNLDYAWEYESVARDLGLRFVSLPSAVDLGDPAMGAAYSKVSVQISRRTRLVVHGAPIVFGVAALKTAPHPSTARAFITYLMSPEGRAILAANGLRRPGDGNSGDRY